MSTVLAIEVMDKEALLVTARAVSDAPIEILSHRRVTLESLPSEAAATEATESIGSETSVEVEPGNPETLQDQNLDDAAPSRPNNTITVAELGEIDEAVALISSSRVLYNATDLPFTDQKKIEQVAPLQVQDVLPFEIDEFIVDSIVVGPGVQDDSQYRVVSSLALREDVAETLHSLRRLGVDPRFVTTRASALGALAQLSRLDLSGLTAFIEFARHEAAIAVLRDGKPFLLRNFPLPDGSLELVARDIACSLAQAERETKLRLRAIHLLGTAENTSKAQSLLGPLAKPLRLSEMVVNHQQDTLSIEDFSWSLGLAATELLRTQKSDYPIVNFRQGQFAYRRIWQELWGALKQELFYITTLVLLVVGYYTSVLYANYHALGEVEGKISQMLTQALPGETVPFRAEEAYLRSKVSDLEEQLRKMGSLSTLSPLQSMKELALAIGPDMDVSVESLEVASSRMMLKGNVASNPVFAALSSALKARNERFCSVQPDTKGRTANNRVAFSAVISLCE